MDIGHGPAILFVAIVAAIVICMLGVLMLRWISRKKNHKTGGQVPPQYR
jgi:amino acid transporter